MDDDIRLSWIFYTAILLFIAAYFAVSETAFASASRTKIRISAERGDSAAIKALHILDHFDRAITTILIGTNIVHLGAAAIVTANITRLFGLSAVSISTPVMTIIVFFAAEMLPKSIGKKNPEKYAKATAPLLLLFMKLFGPLSVLLTKFGELAAKATKGDPEVSVTEDELYDLIEDMTDKGSLDEGRGSLLTSALQFGDVIAESILTPRVDLDAIDIETPPEKIVEHIRKGTHSRYPVYEDNIDNIIGVLQIRTYLKAYYQKGNEIDTRDLLDEVIFVHQSTAVDEVLIKLTREQRNMAVVTDNYGGTLGIVTIENIVEVLFGDIWDEDDIVEEPVVELATGEYLVDADETLQEVFDEIDYEDSEDNDERLNKRMNEWTFEQFDDIPEPGDHFIYQGLKVQIQAMDNHRITKLKISKIRNEQEAHQRENEGNKGLKKAEEAVQADNLEEPQDPEEIIEQQKPDKEKEQRR